MKKALKLKDIRPYFYDEDEIILISTTAWEEHDRFSANSILLEPFDDWYVTDMGCDASDILHIFLKKELPDDQTD